MLDSMLESERELGENDGDGDACHVPGNRGEDISSSPSGRREPADRAAATTPKARAIPRLLNRLTHVNNMRRKRKVHTKRSENGTLVEAPLSETLKRMNHARNAMLRFNADNTQPEGQHGAASTKKSMSHGEAKSCFDGVSVFIIPCVRHCQHPLLGREAGLYSVVQSAQKDMTTAALLHMKPADSSSILMMKCSSDTFSLVCSEPTVEAAVGRRAQLETTFLVIVSLDFPDMSVLSANAASLVTPASFQCLFKREGRAAVMLGEIDNVLRTETQVVQLKPRWLYLGRPSNVGNPEAHRTSLSPSSSFDFYVRKYNEEGRNREMPPQLDAYLRDCRLPREPSGLLPLRIILRTYVCTSADTSRMGAPSPRIEFGNVSDLTSAIAFANRADAPPENERQKRSVGDVRRGNKHELTRYQVNYASDTAWLVEIQKAYYFCPLCSVCCMSRRNLERHFMTQHSFFSLSFVRECGMRRDDNDRGVEEPTRDRTYARVEYSPSLDNDIVDRYNAIVLKQFRYMHWRGKRKLFDIGVLPSPNWDSPRVSLWPRSIDVPLLMPPTTKTTVMSPAQLRAQAEGRGEDQSRKPSTAAVTPARSTEVGNVVIFTTTGNETDMPPLLREYSGVAKEDSCEEATALESQRGAALLQVLGKSGEWCADRYLDAVKCVKDILKEMDADSRAKRVPRSILKEEAGRGRLRQMSLIDHILKHMINVSIEGEMICRDILSFNGVAKKGHFGFWITKANLVNADAQVLPSGPPATEAQTKRKRVSIATPESKRQQHLKASTSDTRAVLNADRAHDKDDIVHEETTRKKQQSPRPLQCEKDNDRNGQDVVESDDVDEENRSPPDREQNDPRHSNERKDGALNFFHESTARTNEKRKTAAGVAAAVAATIEEKPKSSKHSRRTKPRAAESTQRTENVREVLNAKTFYHSRTSQKCVPDDVLNDKDSDDEIDLVRLSLPLSPGKQLSVCADFLSIIIILPPINRSLSHFLSIRCS